MIETLFSGKLFSICFSLMFVEKKCELLVASSIKCIVKTSTSRKALHPQAEQGGPFREAPYERDLNFSG